MKAIFQTYHIATIIMFMMCLGQPLTSVFAQTCPPPEHVCVGYDYKILLTSQQTYDTYQWYRNGVLISGATSSTFTASQPGSYSLVVNGESRCPSGACCPVVIVEDSIANFKLVATSATCNPSTLQTVNNGQLSVSDWKLNDADTTTYFYQVAIGETFDENQVVAGSLTTPVPASGILTNTLSNPINSQGLAFTIRIRNAIGCNEDKVIILPQTICQCPPARCLPIVVKRIK